MSKSVKILVGYHRPATLLKSDVLVPIHLGRALAAHDSKDGLINDKDYQWMLDNMIGDDTGDNISQLNRQFCELTAIYWAWKNYDKLGNPDYIGFMHNRRHLILSPDVKLPEEKFINNLPIFDHIDKKYISSIGLDENIAKSLNCNILPQYVQVNKIHPSLTSNLKSFLGYARTPDFFIEMRNFISSKYDDFKAETQNIANSKKMLPGNVFILEKELFFEYCAFLFDVCFELKNKFNNYSYTTIENIRQIAWTSEFISTIFFNVKMNIYPNKFKQVPLSFINYPNWYEKKTTFKLLYYYLLSKVFFSETKKYYEKKYHKCHELFE